MSKIVGHEEVNATVDARGLKYCCTNFFFSTSTNNGTVVAMIISLFLL